MTFTIEAFVEQYRLRLRRDDCGEQFILCRRGQIFDHGHGRFGLTILNDLPRGWGNARRSMEAAHFHIAQEADDEGAGLFDPLRTRDEGWQPFKVAKPYQRKRLSEETVAKLRQQATIARSAQKTLNSGAPESQDSIARPG